MGVIYLHAAKERIKIHSFAHDARQHVNLNSNHEVTLAPWSGQQIEAERNMKWDLSVPLYIARNTSSPASLEYRLVIGVLEDCGCEAGVNIVWPLFDARRFAFFWGGKGENEIWRRLLVGKRGSHGCGEERDSVDEPIFSCREERS